MPCPPLRILAVEPAFPGRLGALASALASRRGCSVTHLHHRRESHAGAAEVGLTPVGFPVGGIAREPAVPWTRQLERGFCYAYGAFETLRDQPIRPMDLILGHSSGLGSTLFLATLYPSVPILQLIDPYLDPRHHDLADEDAPIMPPEYALWRRSANAMSLLDIESGVVPWSTSAWVRDTYPSEYHASIRVLPEGVDLRLGGKDVSLASEVGGRTIGAHTKLVTFAARSADRLRGIDHFLRLAHRLLAERSDVVCAIVGDPLVNRGIDVRDLGTSPLDRWVMDLGLDAHERLWRLGRLDSAELPSLLARSDLVVLPGRMAEPTRVLGQAMALGRVVLGWDIPPLREWIEADTRGLLVAMGDLDAMTVAALGVLDDPAAYAPLGTSAAEWIRAHCERGKCLDTLLATLPLPNLLRSS